MAKTTLKQLATDVATLLGETLEPECRPEECLFPSIEHRVRILAPGLLASLIIEDAKSIDALDIPDSLYSRLLKSLVDSIQKV